MGNNVGQVLNGINNIYSVLVDTGIKQCRIKGKVLKQDEDSYNPIAVGDWVKIDSDPLSEEVGWITERLDRSSSLVRWNRKKRIPQVIAANVDLVVCVTSVKSPPFRPRFVDRVLVTCGFENIEPLILLNKCDLRLKKDEEERIENYVSLGYRVIRCSAKSGEGLNALREAIAGKLTVFTGQSGVGKSSVLNKLDPGLKLRVGDVSSKFDRGSHTTCYATMVTLENGQKLIDTPGIRELFIHDLEAEQLKFYFVEFPEHGRNCEYPSSCLHLDEPGCGVKEAVARGEIHPDRYESYRRIFDNIKELQQGFNE